MALVANQPSLSSNATGSLQMDVDAISFITGNMLARTPASRRRSVSIENINPVSASIPRNTVTQTKDLVDTTNQQYIELQNRLPATEKENY